MTDGRSASPKPSDASVNRPVIGRSTDATRYSPARYSYVRSPSASRFSPFAMSAKIVPVVETAGAVGFGTEETSTPSMAVRSPSWACRAIRVCSSSSRIVQEDAIPAP